MNPTVSILIPVYNAAPYLAATIESAINQSWPYIEIIIVDDKSSDDSYNIAKQFESDRVNVYQQNNAGACRARNFAFEKSSGDYIQYLDADDLISPGKIEDQIKLLKVEGSVASAAWGRFYDSPETAIFQESPVYKDYGNPVDLLVDMWKMQKMMQTSVWLTPRKLIDLAGPWDESLSLNQDGEFFCRVLLAAKSVMFSDSGKVYYRSGLPGSISKAHITYQRAASLLKSFLSYENEIFKIENTFRVKEGLARNYYSFIYQFHHLYPELTNALLEKINQWQTPPPSNIGGKNFNRFCSIIGFNNALKLKKIAGIK